MYINFGKGPLLTTIPKQCPKYKATNKGLESSGQDIETSVVTLYQQQFQPEVKVTSPIHKRLSLYIAISLLRSIFTM